MTTSLKTVLLPHQDWKIGDSMNPSGSLNLCGGSYTHPGQDGSGKNGEFPQANGGIYDCATEKTT